MKFEDEEWFVLWEKLAYKDYQMYQTSFSYNEIREQIIKENEPRESNKTQEGI